jgi:branched-chain amino acid aminotransferase
MQVTLQKPSHLYMRGAIRPWEEGVLHISTEAVTRGLNVFEGIKGYWQPDGSFGFVALRRHWQRLGRSARLLHIPFEMTFDEFEAACHGLVQCLYRQGVNMWIRATLFVVEGHWGEGTKADLVLTGYHTAGSPPAAVDIGVSTWRRAADVVLPYRIKTSTNYQAVRLGKIEGRGRGYDEMVLLNEHGRVAEAFGSCVVMVRDGGVVTPPAWEGALESITIDLVEVACGLLDIPFARRPIDRTELLIADEVALVGTLVEVTPVRSIDGLQVPDTTIVAAIEDCYLAMVRGLAPHAAVEMSRRPYDAVKEAAE